MEASLPVEVENLHTWHRGFGGGGAWNTEKGSFENG